MQILQPQFNIVENKNLSMKRNNLNGCEKMSVDSPSPDNLDEIFIQDALRVVEWGRNNGLIIRIIGALAVFLQCKPVEDLQKRLGRLGSKDEQRFTDMDLIGYNKQRGKICNMLEKQLGYIIDRYMIMRMAGQKRLKYFHPKNWYGVDIFFNELNFSHMILLGEKPGKGRLELDSPTITLTDLMLEKTQINQINEKDIKDIICILRCHEIGETEGKAVNAKYFAQVLANDWGFWYDATNNLQKVKTFAEKYQAAGLMSMEELTDVTGKVNRILEYVEKEPKSGNWKVRERVGTSKPWYNVVEEPREWFKEEKK